ncbi:hypothetical protein B0H16DRAFT_1273340, partial [Mycena metata]
KKMLSDGELGPVWEGLVDAWWALESSTDFASTTKGHPTTSRPREVGLWVKSARKGTPKVIPESFGKGWWEWWMAINPEWRVSDGSLVKEGDGDWDDLRCPGQNGFLNVIVCLRWWRLAAGTESSEWSRAVSDVKWVLERM